jgi:hypothetical protein
MLTDNKNTFSMFNYTRFADEILIFVYIYLHHWLGIHFPIAIVFLINDFIYIVKFVSDLRQVGSFLRFPPPIKLTAMI